MKKPKDFFIMVSCQHFAVCNAQSYSNPNTHQGLLVSFITRNVGYRKSNHYLSIMQVSELKKYLQSLARTIKADTADIVAETATEYFKGSFRRKAFDGVPWKTGRPKRRGSLLIYSGALMNSIRPSQVNSDRVVISAGNPKVGYAQIHNEGFVGSVNIKAHQRKVKSKGKGKRGKTSVSQVRAHQRRVRIPQRQFMGAARELNRSIKARIEAYIHHTIHS